MENLPIEINIVSNETRVSTLVIAENTNVKYESIRDLVNKYKEELLQFGEICVADLKSATDSLGRINKTKTISLLNEQQATLLITFLKNTKEVVSFKMNLVKAFYMMKERLQNQIQPQEQNILPVLVEMAKVNQMLVQSNQEIVANLTNMNQGLHEMLATMHNIKQDTTKIKDKINNQEDLLKEVRQKQIGLSPTDIVLVKEAIEKRARELSDGDTEKIQALTRSIYSYINGYFNVPAYYFMSWEQSMEARFLIKNLNIGVQNV